MEGHARGAHEVMQKTHKTIKLTVSGHDSRRKGCSHKLNCASISAEHWGFSSPQGLLHFLTRSVYNLPFSSLLKNMSQMLCRLLPLIDSLDPKAPTAQIY